ncbi:MAG: hypothetical protein ACE5GZ_01525 [Gammaproteobacteria bacterium]
MRAVHGAGGVEWGLNERRATPRYAPKGPDPVKGCGPEGAVAVSGLARCDGYLCCTRMPCQATCRAGNATHGGY